MKIRFGINCFNGMWDTGSGLENNVDLVFPIIWRNFIQNNKETPWDFALFYAGFDEKTFDKYTKGCNRRKVTGQTNDAGMTYDGLISGQDYDFTVRCDQDVFIRKEWIQKVHKFLSDNPEVNILSCSNCSQPVTMGAARQFKPQNSIALWGSALLGDSVAFIRQDLFRKAYEEYYTNPFFNKNGVRDRDHPFSAQSLTYGEICDYLERKPEFPEPDAYLFTSGQIGVNFWTAMCKVGVNHAGLCDYNGSCWIHKEKLAYFRAAMKSRTFAEIIDTRPPTPKYKQLPAPFFHMGNSYLTSLHFNTFHHPRFKMEKDSVAEQFYTSHFYNLNRDGHFGEWAAHCAITQILVEFTKEEDLKDLFNRNLDNVLAWRNCPEKEYLDFSRSIKNFYGPEMAEYLEK